MRWLVIAPVLVACGSASVEVGPTHEPVGEPVVRRAIVVRSIGSAPAEEGDDCSLEVTRVTGDYFNCRIRVSCRGEMLYGLPGAGYNRCRMDGEQVREAQDRSGTRRDGDPKLVLDLDQGQVIVSDRDPDMELVLAVESARPHGMGPAVPPGYGSAPAE